MLKPKRKPRLDGTNTKNMRRSDPPRNCQLKKKEHFDIGETIPEEDLYETGHEDEEDDGKWDEDYDYDYEGGWSYNDEAGCSYTDPCPEKPKTG